MVVTYFVLLAVVVDDLICVLDTRVPEKCFWNHTT